MIHSFVVVPAPKKKVLRNLTSTSMFLHWETLLFKIFVEMNPILDIHLHLK